MKPKVKKILHRIFITVTLCVFLFSVWKIVSILRSYSVADKTYDGVFDRFVVLDTAVGTHTSSAETENSDDPMGNSSEGVTEDPDTAGPDTQMPVTEADREEALLKIDFQGLKAYNPDVVGWVYCADTPINYPVLQGDDNDYYLRHMINGEYNIAGSVFMDFRCDPGMNGLNTIIYGHNFNNDIMFGTFLEYKKQSYYDEHPVIWYFTEERNYKLELIAGFVTPSDSVVYRMQDSVEQLEKLVADCRAISTFTPTEVGDDISQIMVLSTCSNESSSTRYVLIANVVPME